MKRHSVATNVGKAVLLFSLVMGANAANFNARMDTITVAPKATVSNPSEHTPLQNSAYIVLVGLGVMGAIAARRRTL